MTRSGKPWLSIRAGITVDDPAFEAVVTGLVEDLRASTDYVDPDGVFNYYELIDSDDPDEIEFAQQLVSDDRLTLLVPTTLVGTLDEVQDHVDAFQTTLADNSTDDIEILSVGTMTVNNEFNTIAEEDLQTGEAIGIPIAFIILILFSAHWWPRSCRSFWRSWRSQWLSGWPRSSATSVIFPFSSRT